jgi:hypothetical protein
VIKTVNFSVRTIKNRKPVRLKVTVTDTRGYLIRGAKLYVRGVPERRINKTNTRLSSTAGTATFTLQPTKLLQLKKGSRLTLFVRASEPGKSPIGGISTRRLISVGVTSPLPAKKSA